MKGGSVAASCQVEVGVPASHLASTATSLTGKMGVPSYHSPCGLHSQNRGRVASFPLSGVRSPESTLGLPWHHSSGGGKESCSAGGSARLSSLVGGQEASTGLKKGSLVSTLSFC